MSKLVFAFFLSCVAALLVSVGTTGAPVPRGSPPKSPLDLTKPDSWEEAVKAEKDKLTEMAKTLIVVAQDERRSNRERTKAILALGRMNNKESFSFLLENTELYIEQGLTPDSRSQALLTPCSAALMWYADWNVVPLIMEKIKMKRTKGQLLEYRALLVDKMMREGAVAFIASELAKEKEDGPRKQNLEFLKRGY